MPARACAAALSQTILVAARSEADAQRVVAQVHDQVRHEIIAAVAARPEEAAPLLCAAP